MGYIGLVLTYVIYFDNLYVIHTFWNSYSSIRLFFGVAIAVAFVS